MGAEKKPVRFIGFLEYVPDLQRVRVQEDHRVGSNLHIFIGEPCILWLPEDAHVLAA